MIDPNEYYRGAQPIGVYEGQTRQVMWTEGDWVLYKKHVPRQDDRVEAYIMHDCDGEGLPDGGIGDDHEVRVGILGTDLMNSRDTVCFNCKIEVPDAVQTLYRIYGWGLNKEVL